MLDPYFTRVHLRSSSPRVTPCPSDEAMLKEEAAGIDLSKARSLPARK